MADKILVTGGAGFIGAALVHSLLQRGYEIRVLDDMSRGAPRRLQDVINDVELIHGDVRDAEIVADSIDGCDIVAHLAFINGTKFFYERPREVLEVGVLGALNTLTYAVGFGAREYWYMSSSEVYQTPPTTPTAENVPMMIPDPRNPRYSYGGGKLISEIMAFNYGRGIFEKTVVVRPHNVYGPDMGWEHVIPDFIVRAKTEFERTKVPMIDFAIQGSGKQQRSFCYIDDFTRGCLSAFLDGGDQEIYHVGSNFVYPIETLAYAVCAKIGCLPSLKTTPEPPGGTYMRNPDISKVKSLGYEPMIDLSEGLDRTIPWYLENLDLQPTF